MPRQRNSWKQTLAKRKGKTFRLAKRKPEAEITRNRAARRRAARLKRD